MPGRSPQRPPPPGGPYLVVGLARSGQAAARLLAARGERVIGADSGSPAGAAGLADIGVEVLLDVDGTQAAQRARCVIKSPGVRPDAPAIVAARERGLPVIGELELAWRLLPNAICAVTGTNGKTTVAELLGHVWRTAGEPVAVAGNVGTPLASLVGEVSADATIVCEASSFQLEDTDAFAPQCAALLNVAPDHLDRHGSLDRYLAAKLRIFRNQGNDDACVYNGSDPALRGVDLGGCGRRVAFCREPGAGQDCQAVVVGPLLELWGEPLLAVDELALLGPHNADNAAAAAAAAAMGIEREAIAAALRGFGGVPHRLERVAELDGVLYVNDSKATNVAAAGAALRSFERGVHVILGGSVKGAGFDELAEPVIERCAGAYLIGAAAERIEADLAPAWEAGIARRRCETLAEAVVLAAEAARRGDVVLLAPACASFDAYRDFEARGEHFRELVEGLR
ncbi:MAG: UDP-N-acetylmuramoyl-L-alanine--D-glutamate ligase [Solirubrobacterales bacterium]|nr:UDP-N-acetylmuramoyl-L-alanine--D-glutamate ligase [Solirubrobacterales bacterium]